MSNPVGEIFVNAMRDNMTSLVETRGMTRSSDRPQMTVVYAPPPNIAQIAAVFPISRTVIFAYGDLIYNPSGQKLPKSLIEHEAMHGLQQLTYSPEGQRTAEERVERWWQQYLVDATFRLSQEVEAHVVEYRTAIRGKRGRHKTQQILTQIASKLSSPLYGKLLSLPEAISLIRGY